MFENPSDEWQRLTEHYHTMFDGQLEELAGDFKDLTQTAQEVLRNEMRNRGLRDPAAPPKKPERPAAPIAVAPSHFASEVDPDTGAGGHSETKPGEEYDGSRDYTWKTTLCDCDDQDQATMLRETLRRAGIESWVDAPGRYAVDVQGPRLLVAADQLEEAVDIASQPIPKEVVEWFSEDVPEYIPPRCPQCGAEDPVLESAEPANSWLCEACGRQWVDPAAPPQ
jgi:hypothetical protein